MQRRRAGKENVPFNPPKSRLRGHINTAGQEQTPHFSLKEMKALQRGGLQMPSTGSPATWDFIKTRRGRREQQHMLRQKAEEQLGVELSGSIPVVPYTMSSLRSAEQDKT